MRLAVGRLMAGAVMISFSGVWVKLSHVSAASSAFYRVLFGGIVLLVAAFYRREIRWWGRRHLLLGMLCGFFFALDLVFYHACINLVGPGLGTMLPSLQVFILALIGVLFLKERLKPISILSMPLALLGLYLVVGYDWRQLDTSYRQGLYYGLATAVCYGGFLLTLRKLQSEQQGLSLFYVLTLVSLLTAAFIGVEAFIVGRSLAIPDTQTLGALLALGLFSQCIGWVLITTALPHVRASLSGLVLLLQPALSFVWDVLFFHRPTGLLNWIGVVIALAAIYMGAAPRANRTTSSSPPR